MSTQTRSYIEWVKGQHLCVPFVAGLTNPSVEHLFIYCEFACGFWLSVTNWLERYGMNVNVLSAANITFGILKKDIQFSDQSHYSPW